MGENYNGKKNINNINIDHVLCVAGLEYDLRAVGQAGFQRQPFLVIQTEI